MGPQKFDDLVKQFCTTRLTRWGALRGLVAGAAAAVTGSALATDDADAKKGRHGAHSQSKGKGKGKAHGDNKGGKKGGAKKKGGDKKGSDKKKGTDKEKGTASGADTSRGADTAPAATRDPMVAAAADKLCPVNQDKVCHCPPGQNGGNCQTTGNGAGHTTGEHLLLDCCCTRFGAPDPNCSCPSDELGVECCKPTSQSCANSDQCCTGFCCDIVNGIGTCFADSCPDRCAGVVCQADQCQNPGTCDPLTGQCSAPTPKANGTGCNDGDACTQTDTCQGGVC